MELFEKAWPFIASSDGIFTQKLAAEGNKLRILGLIVQRKCLSQRQLATATGLQPSTISNIVRNLKEVGLVREGAPIEADRVGPKETELEISAGSAWSVGLGLDPSCHRLLVLNAMGHTLAQESLPPGLPVKELDAIIPGKISALASRLGLDPSRLAGVGVSVPGAVNADTGTVLISRALDLHRYPLRASLETALACPVWVERNVSCGAYAEHHIGAARDYESFVYFATHADAGKSHSFGMAIVIAEKIFHGCNSAAGEVDRNLLFNAFEQNAALWQKDSGKLDDFYASFARAMGGITNLLDIGCVVLSSNDEHLTDERFEKLRGAVNSSLIPIPDRRFELIRSGMGIDGMLLGGALLALHRGLAQRLAHSAAEPSVGPRRIPRK